MVLLLMQRDVSGSVHGFVYELSVVWGSERFLFICSRLPPGNP